MENLRGTARRALAQVGLRRGPHELLPTAGEHPGRYNPVDRDDDDDDAARGNSDDGSDERLLASPPPSEERQDGSDPATTACEKTLGSRCGCACHVRPRPTPRLPRGARRGVARAAMTPARIHLFASLFWVLGVLLIVVAFRGQRDGSVPAGGTFGWSPVVDDGAVEYVEFTFPYFDVDPGQDLWNNKPTYEQDVRWYESYNWLTRVPTKAAEKGMPNGTVKIPGDEENSLVWLGVFHEMHCLNVIRKLVWFEYYDVLADLVAGRNNMRNHLIHCVDAIRKGIMCHADVTPVPFWSAPELKNGEINPMFKIPHTCRSYDRVRAWAEANVVTDYECADEAACGALNALTMTVPPGDPQPTHWPDPNPAPAPKLSAEELKILNCDKTVLDWCE